MELRVALTQLAIPRAPAPAYRLRTWTTEDGLPINQLSNIGQTPDGYLWFTTADGLVRFDGQRFTTFNKSTDPAIPSNRMNALCILPDGTMWIGTDSNGVVRYQNGKFT